MKSIKYLIGIIGIGLSCLIALALNFYFQSTITFWDYPAKLSQQTETIEVVYINWACDCADFVETKYLNNPSGKIQEEDCIFIEPAQAVLKLPERFYEKDHFEKKLRLHGQFYQGKGISRSYEQKTPEKPIPARVFWYSKVEILDFRE